MSIIIKGITKAQFYKDTNKTPYMDVGWDIEELPPHGRLVDADALIKEWESGFYRRIVEALMEDAPTIIEAEEAEE